MAAAQVARASHLFRGDAGCRHKWTIHLLQKRTNLFVDNRPREGNNTYILHTHRCRWVPREAQVMFTTSWIMTKIRSKGQVGGQGIVSTCIVGSTGGLTMEAGTPHDRLGLSQAKPSQAKPSQAKPSQAKPSQAKPSQAKPSQAKAGVCLEPAPAAPDGAFGVRT